MTTTLEAQREVVDYVKETYHYRADRVLRALDRLSGEGEEP